ncbi:hypothetical protein [Saliterribacillus persicus]|uniref:Uncharacterized protein n=1 Tax=Saliterribacillus persicus TaxID=930114 RepID=A0A368X885_9BACI|nr:hypothetical protein [Saliterribacillus persicus]RCW63919.1 hypothetical protein DFR57_11544 [Saliterribacillus persicus]
MRKLFSVLSLTFTLLGLSTIIFLLQGGSLFEILTFGTKGTSFIVFLNLYNLLGLLFAFPAERNKYSVLLFTFSIIMLLNSLILTFVAVYGFQEP